MNWEDLKEFDKAMIIKGLCPTCGEPLGEEGGKMVCNGEDGNSFHRWPCPPANS